MDTRTKEQVDSGDTIHITLVEALQLLDATSCSMWYTNGSGVVCHDAVGQGADVMIGRQSECDEMMDWIIIHEDPVRVGSVADQGRYYEIHHESIDRQIGLVTRSVLVVPVWVDDRLTGIVRATSSEPGQFDDQALALLEVLVGWMSIVMERIELQKYYQELFEHAPVPLYRASPDGQILAINDAALELLGERELLRSNISGWFVDPRDYLAWKRGDKRVFQFLRGDEKVIWVRDVSRPVENAAGEIIYVEGSLEDVTDHKRAERSLNNLSEQGLGARDVRVVLRSRAVMEDYNLDEMSCTEAMRRFREAQIEAVGLRRYIYDVLGDRGNYPAQSVVFWYGEKTHEHEFDTTVANALIELAQSVGLPDKVEFEVEDRTYLI